jgi:adenylate cyclase
MKQRAESLRLPVISLLGGLLVAMAGWLLAPSMARLSYDLPFCLRWSGSFRNIVLVYVDENALQRYGGHNAASLDRRVQDRLLKRLTSEHARLVIYDFVFDFTNQPPEVDEVFGETIARNGKVVLGATEQRVQEIGTLLNARADVVLAPVPALRRGAAWGLVDLEFGPDKIVRRLPSGTADYPSAAWVAARMLGAASAQHDDTRLTERWLNYYGPPGMDAIPYRSFERALEPAGVPAGYFTDKIVIVCPRSHTPTIGQMAEEFSTPYSRFGYSPAPGAEIHATALLNLIHNEWLTRVNYGWELLMVSILGIGLGAGLTRLQPWSALAVAAFFCILITFVAVYLQLTLHFWWSWLTPVAVQAPLALVWAVAAQYVLETRKRLRLRKAFGAYLSPEMAEQISQSNFDLSLGGKIVEATIMFTDLEGFTGISESLEPDQVSRLLTTYFNQTSKTVLQRNGTIIKYIGDAIMAVWGAPIPDPQQAEKAVLAAWEMVQAGRQEIAGHKLRTRVGIHSGRALAGNLGSDVRFDYTVIGDTTNCASRLESANKYFKTEILISEATRKQLSEAVRTRRLGLFRLAGRAEPIEIHEVLGPADRLTQSDQWVQVFEQAVACFCARKFDDAKNSFSQVTQMRGHADGPSQMYLEQIEAILKKPPADSWNGVVDLVSK